MNISSATDPRPVKTHRLNSLPPNSATMSEKHDVSFPRESVHERRPSNTEAIHDANRKKSVSNRVLTGASALTVRQSILPITLVTVLFFLWGFAVSPIQGV